MHPTNLGGGLDVAKEFEWSYTTGYANRHHRLVHTEIMKNMDLRSRLIYSSRSANEIAP